MRNSPGKEISKGHCAYEGQDEHAHYTPAHFVSYELLEQSVGDGDGRDYGETNSEEKD